MAGKTRYLDPPGSPENAYVREALAACDLTQDQIAEALNDRRLGSRYDKSIVGKMARTRKVTARELSAIEAITGHPIPESLLRQSQPSPEIAATVERMTTAIERIKGHPGLLAQTVSFAQTLELAAQALEQEQATDEDPEAAGDA